MPEVPQFMFGPPQPLTPEQQAAAEEQRRAVEVLERRQADMEIELRLAIQRFAPMACSCRRRFGWNGGSHGPPQHGCVVHGGYMIRYDTEEVM
jgi:hypothetical protein